MNKRAFLIAFIAAFVAAGAGVVLKGRSDKSPPPPSALKGGESCRLTQCRFSPVISPRLQISSADTDLIGIWNVTINGRHTMDMTNISEENVVVKSVKLSLCVDDAITPVDDIPEACRFMQLASSGCDKGEPWTMEPGMMCSTTIEVGKFGLIGQLQIETTVGPIIVMIVAQ